MKTLIDIFNYSPADENGIFHYLQLLDVPWQELNIENSLDVYYFLNRSGKKDTSPLIDYYINDGVISELHKAEIATIIYDLFGKIWGRMWEVYNAEYNPINNYDMTEESGDVKTIEYGKTDTNTLAHGRTDTRTDNLTQTDTPTTTQTKEENIFGFNDDTEEGSPANKSVITDGGQNVTANTGTQTNVVTGTDTDTNVQSGVDTHRVTHSLTRSGNIGVTTTQQMLQSDIELWQWNFFKNVVMPNIDGVLTTMLY